MARLSDFDDPVLVAGCQRSGTTALARRITLSAGMSDYWFGYDDELDAAMILANCVPHDPVGRYCFQTTYLNECYREYFEHADSFQLIWMIRNPLSVVYSMLHNWGRFALGELFRHCGIEGLESGERARFARYGSLAVSWIKQACLSYNAKTSQIVSIHERLGSRNVIVLDYDALVESPGELLPVVYEFLDLGYLDEYADSFSAASLQKADRFSAGEREYVERTCDPVYRKVRELFIGDDRFSGTLSVPTARTATGRIS